MPDIHAEFLSHYERELGYLRQRGADFAARYPKIAGRLEVGADISPDPHVERLLESFAFLTGRIQQRLDSDFPLVSASMLGVLYPQFLNPVPSVSIARIEVDPDQGKLTTGYTIGRHTQMSAETPQGLTCRFRTTYPVTLWPIAVREAEFEPPEKYDFLEHNPDVVRVLRLRLESTADPFGDLEVDRLRFYLSAPPLTANGVYELLFAHLQGVALLPEGEGARPIQLPSDAIEPVGFGPDEGAFPYPPNSHSGYRLLQEYFTFPSKFQFFDLTGLEVLRSGRSVEVLLLLDRMPAEQVDVDEENFLLGCTPIVNLFRQTSEPIRLDQREAEYRLVPDARRERTTEIHSILSVSATADAADPTEVYAPYFSYNHRMQAAGQKSFWVMRREPTNRTDLPGTQVFLSMVDLGFNPSEPPAKTIYAHTLCTNRALASQIPAQASLQMEQAAPVAWIACLDKPTPQLEPPLGGDTLWRLISHLSLNHLSLTGGEESLSALQEILRLYSFSERPSTEQQIQGIREMSSRPIVRRIGSEGWRGFCRGTEVSLTLDEDGFVGGSTFLFASVLNRFLALYASVNSFTQLSLTSAQREGTWHQWPPMAGDQPLL